MPDFVRVWRLIVCLTSVCLCLLSPPPVNQLAAIGPNEPIHKSIISSWWDFSPFRPSLLNWLVTLNSDVWRPNQWSPVSWIVCTLSIIGICFRTTKSTEKRRDNSNRWFASSIISIIANKGITVSVDGRWCDWCTSWDLVRYCAQYRVK